MTLKADLRAMADAIALPDSDLHKRIESALHAAIKRVLEQEPSLEMLNAGIAAWAANNVTFGGVYRAMTAELLRELEGK